MNYEELRLHPNLLLIPGLFAVLFVILYWASGLQNAEFLWLCGLIVLVVAGAVVVDIFRLRGYAEKQQAHLTAMQWAPFGPGWLAFGRKNSNLYKITFVDASGNETTQHVRVSLFYGIEVTD